MAEQVIMEGVTVIFRNFAGRESTYNQKGVRNFGVLLDPTIAETMAADGWNVKYLEPREDDAAEGDERQPWLPVEISFDKGRPPRVVMIGSQSRTELDGDTIQTLDNVSISNVDLIVNPYQWEVQGKGGIKAYVKTMFVTIEEDYLERKYAQAATVAGDDE